MNLLHDPWMPVRDAQGRREWITPDRLAEPQWQAFDADRPDFNGALAQFAIGLLQTTTPVADSIEWRGLFNAPPDATQLQRWFVPVAAAFKFDGDGPRFMQDLDLTQGGDGVTQNDIGALLIESPGENTAKNNADHFIKRGQILALCPACAATALFTLQLNAPSGGAGHRTGLRGGGPLTTLVLGPSGGHLWHDLWMNVRDRPDFLAQVGDAEKSGLPFNLPWLESITALQTEKGELTPIQVHPAHVFWAMPRRIRLDMGATAQGTCAACSQVSDRLITRYLTKNYGLNYKGDWNHPLSPYYETKEGWLPLHPQPDGLGYKHWLGWVLGAATDKSSRRPAQTVNRALGLSHRQTGGQLRLWAFGYDMDNMKARCWYESTLPLYAVADCAREARQIVQAEVSRWLQAATLASSCLRGAVKDAWFSVDARGEFGHIDAAFWSATEPAFYRHLQALIEAARTGTDHPPLPTRQAWHTTLVREATRLFDHDVVGSGAVERQNPRRAALAFKQLRKNLYGPKMRLALGLPTNEPPTQSARKLTRRKSQEAA